MDGKQIRAMVDPYDTVAAIKVQLQKDSGIPAKNQAIYMGGDELKDPNKLAKDYGVKAGSELDLEPRTIKLKVLAPDGNTYTVEAKPSDTVEALKVNVAKESGVAPHRQVIQFNGKDLDGGKTLKQYGIQDGSDLTCGIYKIPITVETFDGRTIRLRVEPTNKIEEVKVMIRQETGHEPKRQCLKYGDNELSKGSSTLKDYQVNAGSTLHMSLTADPIVFVDIKCGTLFAVDRDEVIERGALTPHQNNKLDFTEAAQDGATKTKIGDVMKGSPTLGVSPQVVVAKDDVEDYEMQEAEKVSSMWGVKLKKRERNKKGEEFFFVDLKTGAIGELARKKYLDMNFITPTTENGKETLAEAEKDTMQYDHFIHEIRKIFGIQTVN